MNRRELITLIGGAAAASSLSWPLAARAQPAERVRNIGVLVPAAAGTAHWQAWLAAFREGLQKLGWSEGRKVRIAERWGADAEQLRAHAAELAAMKPDVILASAA